MSLAARVARRFLAGSVSVTIDRDETLAARKKWPAFDGIIVGTFDSSFGLYRAFDGPELKRILRGGKITGGKFSVPAERAYGASWGHNVTEVIQGLNRERGRRLGGDIYLAKVDALDRKFLHLGPDVPFDPSGPPYQAAVMSADKCSVGLGCSMLVDGGDVDAFYVVHPDHRIEPVRASELSTLVEHLELEEDKPAKRELQKVHGVFAVQPRDKFTVDKGSTKMGVGTRNSGSVVDVYQYDTALEDGDRRVWVQLAFTWPLKNGDRSRRTLYAIHPNRLKDFDGPGVKLHDGSGSNHIVVRRLRK